MVALGLAIRKSSTCSARLATPNYTRYQYFYAAVIIRHVTHNNPGKNSILYAATISHQFIYQQQIMPLKFQFPIWNDLTSRLLMCILCASIYTVFRSFNLLMHNTASNTTKSFAISKHFISFIVKSFYHC